MLTHPRDSRTTPSMVAMSIPHANRVHPSRQQNVPAAAEHPYRSTPPPTGTPQMTMNPPPNRPPSEGKIPRSPGIGHPITTSGDLNTRQPTVNVPNPETSPQPSPAKPPSPVYTTATVQRQAQALLASITSETGGKDPEAHQTGGAATTANSATSAEEESKSSDTPNSL